eukprot:1969471-Prymnesium_polylepis.1
MWVCPFPTPSTAHKHCTRTAHHWPGETCRLVPMGHRAFLRAGICHGRCSRVRRVEVGTRVACEISAPGWTSATLSTSAGAPCTLS